MPSTLPYGVTLIRRDEWGARRPKMITPMRPTYGTTVHWEGPGMGGFTHDRCPSKVRSIQTFHMDSRHWSDIAYHALVCPHGVVFEGRWIGVRGGANGTTLGNNTAYAVCYLGGLGDPFTEPAKTAYVSVLEHFVKVGAAGPGVNCHRDWKSTECPGDTICAWVKSGRPATIPGPRPPAPTPPPSLLEEDDVFLYNGPSTPVFFCHAGQSVGLNESTDLATFQAAGIPRLVLDDDTFAKFRSRFPGA